MGLRLKFNLILLLVVSIGIVVSSFLARGLLETQARDEVLQQAGAMMEAAHAVRQYTVEQIRPHLEKQMSRQFMPQTVPAYAATEVFNALRAKYPDFLYKEATLNPTNPRDRAADWEADIIQRFVSFPDQQEISGERHTPTGPALFFARPIKIVSEACLTCHSLPAAAPKTLLAQYGDANGFGWKLNEIVGAQVISVPMKVAIERANKAFAAFISSLLGVFALVFVALNIMLTSIVIKPITKLARLAEQMSTGKLDLPEFNPSGTDEVSQMAHSFNRMRRSLEQAMKMIDNS